MKRAIVKSGRLLAPMTLLMWLAATATANKGASAPLLLLA
jgi:hypothetical protein